MIIWLVVLEDLHKPSPRDRPLFTSYPSCLHFHAPNAPKPSQPKTCKCSIVVVTTKEDEYPCSVVLAFSVRLSGCLILGLCVLGTG
ncbi:hypothetical protein ElyMa_003349800 [Elysia marginata]|uniref:Uncharacterized protein n=1 Tax=Elysia marginata TaxID=1093978 RepID=A0AAV4JMW8_9GAST|nr:hypothetical protein ElyMa_003349800 [Elysia marginata]